MRRAGREEWKRIASVVLVALIATLSLPLGASAVAQAAGGRPASGSHIKRLHVEARPVSTSRRPLVGRDATLPSTSLLVAALVVIGLLAASGPTQRSWALTLLPVQRGPPSLR